MKCLNCSTELKPNAIFCTNCGAKVKIIDTMLSSSKEISVGRSHDNMVRIESESVSSHHALIIIDGNAISIRDLNSTNGTFVDNQKVQFSEVNWDSTVFLGRSFELDLHTIPEVAAVLEKSRLGVVKTPAKTIIDSNRIENPLLYEPSINENTNQYVPPKSVSMQQQVNINIQQAPKSVGVSIVLTFFFGPLGMLYSTVTGGLIMLVVSVICAIFTFGFSVFITHPICVIWGAIAADSENKKILVSTRSIS